MENSNVVDQIHLHGKVGRKTGFQVTRTPKKGQNGLEDVNDFFLSEDEFEPTPELGETSPAKRLTERFRLMNESFNIEKKTVKPLDDTEHLDFEPSVTPVNSKQEEHVPILDENLGLSDDEIEETIKDAEDLGTPIRISKNRLTSLTGSPAAQSPQPNVSLLNTRKVTNAGKLTKNIVLNRNTKTSRFQPQNIVSNEGSTSENEVKHKNEIHKSKDANILETDIPEDVSVNETNKEIGNKNESITSVEKIPEKVSINSEQEKIKERPKSANKGATEPPQSPSEGYSEECLDATNHTQTSQRQISVHPSESNYSAIELSKKTGLEADVSIKSDRLPLVSESTGGKVDQEISQATSKTVDSAKSEGLIAPQEALEKMSTECATKGNENVEQDQGSNGIQPLGETHSESPKAQKNTNRRKSITTNDIVERIIIKDTKTNMSSPIRKLRTPRRATLNKDYSLKPPSFTLTQGAEENTTNAARVTDKKSLLESKNVQPVKKSTIQSKIVQSLKTSPLKSKGTQQVKNSPMKPNSNQSKTASKTAKVPNEPHFVRRSTRTRVAPLATWKNEKIVYKTEKINGVIVKSVDNVLHKDQDVEMFSQGPAKAAKSTVIGTPNKGHSKRTPSKKTKPATPVKVRKASKLNEKASKNNKKTTNVKEAIKAKSDSKPDVQASKTHTVPIEIKTTPRGPKKNSELKRAYQDSDSNLKRKMKKVSSPVQRTHEVVINSDEDSIVNGSLKEERDPGTSWQKNNKGALSLSVFEGPGTGKQVNRTVAYAPDSYKNVTVIKNKDEYFKVGTLFDQDCEFCGGGVIELPFDARKAVKSNHDTYFIFYVICGKVEVILSRNTFVVTEGCSFEIPMGNYYQFHNVGDVTAKMMFVQSKYIVIGDNITSESDSNDESDE